MNFLSSDGVDHLKSVMCELLNGETYFPFLQPLLIEIKDFKMSV